MHTLARTRTCAHIQKKTSGRERGKSTTLDPRFIYFFGEKGKRNLSLFSFLLSPFTFHFSPCLVVHGRTTKGVSTGLDIHTLVLRDILRGVLAEVAQIIGKLHRKVATHNAVP